MSVPAPTRRARHRQQTTDEIKQLARDQLAEAGPAAVSLNAIAKAMAMSPGALYRYFASRDDLLAELAVDAYDSLAGRLEQAVAAGGDAPGRLTRVAQAYTAWAAEQPHTYHLVFETPAGSGRDLARDRIVPAAQRSMNVLLAVLAELGPPARPVPLPAGLASQVSAWARRTSYPDLPVAVLHLALAFWGRLHGLVSLALGHHLDATGVNADLLIQAEVNALLAAFDHLPAEGRR